MSFRTRSTPSVQTLRCTTPPRLCPGISADTTTHQSQGCSRNRSEPAQAHTNPIIPEGGFLQVAVSEAPVDSAAGISSSLVGASDTALRLHITYSFQLSLADEFCGLIPSSSGSSRQSLLWSSPSHRRRPRLLRHLIFATDAGGCNCHHPRDPLPLSRSESVPESGRRQAHNAKGRSWATI